MDVTRMLTQLLANSIARQHDVDIVLLNEVEAAEVGLPPTATGGYTGAEIVVVVGDHDVASITRTLFHELAHALHERVVGSDDFWGGDWTLSLPDWTTAIAMLRAATGHAPSHDVAQHVRDGREYVAYAYAYVRLGYVLNEAERELYTRLRGPSLTAD